MVGTDDYDRWEGEGSHFSEVDTTHTPNDNGGDDDDGHTLSRPVAEVRLVGVLLITVFSHVETDHDNGDGGGGGGGGHGTLTRRAHPRAHTQSKLIVTMLALRMRMMMLLAIKLIECTQ